MSMERDRTEADANTVRYQPAPTDVIAEDTGVASASRGAVVYTDQTKQPNDHDQAGDTDDNPPEVEEIRTEIEQTRAEMSQTIDAIQERLSPHRLAQEAQESVKETVRDATIGRAERMMNEATDKAEEWVDNASDTARDFGMSFMDTVRANPVPAALAGIGLGWLFMSARNRGSSHDDDRRYRAYRQATQYAPYGSRPGERTYGGYSRGYAGSGYDRGYRSGRGYGYAGGYADTDADRDRGVTERVGDAAADVQERAGEMMSQAGGRVSDAARGMAENVGEWTDAAQERFSDMNLVDTVRRNPVPAALVGLGLAWMFKNMREEDHGYGRDWQDRDYGGYSPGYASGSYRRGYGYDRGYGYADMNGTYDRDTGRGLTDRAGEAVSDAGDRVSEMASRVGDTAGQVQDRAGEFVGQVTDNFGDWTDAAQDRFGDVRGQADRFLDESPLAAGAIALALGVGVGMLLPSTRQEARILGPARERFMDQAQDVVEETTHKVQRVVSEVQDSVKDTVKEEAQKQGLTGRQPSSSTQGSGPSSQSSGSSSQGGSSSSQQTSTEKARV
jgi:ElaB/YqjD/DUF883 family membrane-anchored ribosome-binding protein